MFVRSTILGLTLVAAASAATAQAQPPLAMNTSLAAPASPLASARVPAKGGKRSNLVAGAIIPIALLAAYGVAAVAVVASDNSRSS